MNPSRAARTDNEGPDTPAFLVSPEDGSVYTLDPDGSLVQHAIYADGTFGLGDDGAGAVDWSRGVSDEDEPRLRAIAEMLKGMSPGENNLEAVEGYRLKQD